MFTVLEILAILFIHWVADFIFQDEKWALGKSKNWNDLLSHTITYSGIWLIIGIIYAFLNGASGVPWIVIQFTVITFICHTATDYVTSRRVSQQFGNGKYGSKIPNLGGFTTIGFDQVLHYIQLFLTYQILFK